MSGVVDLLWWLPVLVLGARLAVGWARAVRWDPDGDPSLVAAMTATRPRIPARAACAVVDLAGDAADVRRAFNRCDGSTVFETGSVTKALTGLLLAVAIGRGELDLDTTLAEALPELAGRASGAVTMGDLARHRSGLPRNPLGRAAPFRLLATAYLGLDPDRRLDEDAVLRIARRARRRGAGTERYSNLGAALVGHALARRAGTTYPALLTERVLAPLGMASTSADPAAARPSGRGRLGMWVQPWRLDGYAAAGGVTSTLDDMVLLLRSLLDGSCPGTRAMDDALFWQVQTLSDGRRRIWHNGETGGYSAYLALFPRSRRAVVVLSAHADASKAQQLAAACLRSRA